MKVENKKLELPFRQHGIKPPGQFPTFFWVVKSTVEKYVYETIFSPKNLPVPFFH